MKKDLPKIYANPTNKKFTNVQETYYDRMVEEVKPKANSINIDKKINEIFASKDFVYKKEALIKLHNNLEINKHVIGRNDHYLLTLDNEPILISDILDINVQ